MLRSTKPAKRILYVLRKNGGCYLYELSFGKKQRLIKKGLIQSNKSYPYKNSNNPICRAHYKLTDEGKVVADKIIQEVKDEYDYYNEWV
jgi:hypothetical protein